jgi:hypothetical protein
MPEIGKSGSMWRGLETEPSKSVTAPALDPARRVILLGGANRARAVSDPRRGADWIT